MKGGQLTVSTLQVGDVEDVDGAALRCRGGAAAEEGGLAFGVADDGGWDGGAEGGAEEDGDGGGCGGGGEMHGGFLWKGAWLVGSLLFYGLRMNWSR